MPLTPTKYQFRILESRHQLISKDWNFRDVYSSYWRLYSNPLPGAALHHSGYIHPLKPGFIHLVPPWFLFSCSNKQFKIPHAFLHFEMPGMTSRLSLPAFQKPIQVALTPDLSHLEEKWRSSLQESSEKPEAVEHLSLALLHAAWARLLEFQVFGKFQKAFRDSRIASIIETIHGEFFGDLSTSRLAKMTNLSGDHFSRLFRKETGTTPNRYIQEVRVQEASRLLAFSDRSIDQIAQDCGFLDRYYFTRVFSSWMGAPPAQYRRRELANRSRSSRP